MDVVLEEQKNSRLIHISRGGLFIGSKSLFHQTADHPVENIRIPIIRAGPGDAVFLDRQLCAGSIDPLKIPSDFAPKKNTVLRNFSTSRSV